VGFYEGNSLAKEKAKLTPKTRDWLSRDGWQASGDYKTIFNNLL
jgi:hypothetical protein